MIDNPETPNPGANFKGAVQERAAVTMSWRGAKIMRDNLAKIIEAYEEANGEIVVDLNLPGNMP